MATVVTIDGSAVACPRPVCPVRLDAYRARGGTPTFVFEVRDGQPPADPDPYLGKEVTVTVGGTLYFTGDVVQRDPEAPTGGGRGWIKRYTAHGLRDRGDRIPHTDPNDGSDTSSYNLSLDNHSFEYRAARAGRTVGEILQDVLEGAENAAALDAAGIGNYTSLSPPTLPTATTDDLAALTHRPPGGLTFGGERLLTAIDGLVTTWAPNHRFDVDPDGTLRFRDQRDFTPQTLTLGTDPIDPTPLRRDLDAARGRVVVRGQPVAEIAALRLSNGTLSEDPFAHSGLTVSQAKAAWTPANFWRQDAQSEGTCTCLSTTSVRVDPTDASQAWASNYWDATSTGRQGVVQLIDDSGTSIAMFATRNVTANTALTAGGTSDLTLDRALPHTDFDRFELRGLVGGATNVWRVYEVPSWLGAKLAKQSSYPYAFKLANGSAATMTSLPMGSVMWSSSGNAPYQEVAFPITVDPDAGTVTFPTPTWIAAGNRPPSEVRAFVPFYSGANTVTLPADVSGSPQYEGTAHDVEGWDHTLTVTSRGWRDPANRSAVEAWAQELLDSVKDAVVEGVVVYKGLWTAALTPGLSVSIDGDGITTWDDAELPIVDCSLEWVTQPGVGLSHRTIVRCSNRRAALSDAAYLQPDRTGIAFDWGGGGTLDVAGAMRATGALDFNPGGAVGAMVSNTFAGLGGVAGGATASASGLVSGSVAGLNQAERPPDVGALLQARSYDQGGNAPL